VTSISQQNPVKVFVAHSFEAGDDYLRIFEYLESSHNFFYRNCSSLVQPAGDERAAQHEELRKQIVLAEVVVIPSSLHRTHRTLVEFQLNCAKGMDKPVVVLENFGVKEKVPVQLEVLADEVIDWNERTLVDAIRRQARHEETTRWDTIDFKMD
jgi:hypothetical protein